MANDRTSPVVYVPTSPPTVDDSAVLREWLQRESWAIYQGLQSVGTPGIQIESPLHPVVGTVSYFAASAIGGNPEGLFYYTPGFWHLIQGQNDPVYPWPPSPWPQT